MVQRAEQGLAELIDGWSGAKTRMFRAIQAWGGSLFAELRPFDASSQSGAGDGASKENGPRLILIRAMVGMTFWWRRRRLVVGSEGKEKARAVIP